MTDIPLEKLLQGAFKGPEWDYVSKHPAFIEQLRLAASTHESYEQLVQIGSLLIRQREELAALLRHSGQKN